MPHRLPPSCVLPGPPGTFRQLFSHHPAHLSVRVYHWRLTCALSASPVPYYQRKMNRVPRPTRARLPHRCAPLPLAGRISSGRPPLSSQTEAASELWQPESVVRSTRAGQQIFPCLRPSECLYRILSQRPKLHGGQRLG